MSEPNKVAWYNRRWFERLIEIIPGAVSWATLVAPVVISLFVPVAVAYYIIAFDLYWMIKSFHMSYNLIVGYKRLRASEKIDWRGRLEWFDNPSLKLKSINKELGSLKKIGSDLGLRRRRLIADKKELTSLAATKGLLDPKKIFNAVIIPILNEVDVIESTIKSLTETDYPVDRLMLIVSYEERGGAEVEQAVRRGIAKYGSQMALAMAVKHPDLSDRPKTKAENSNFAGRILAKETLARGIDPDYVIVTSLDSDHRVSKSYFSCLTYSYASEPNRRHRSFQPIPLFLNNIWDAPAAMRVIAIGNSFWTLMETMRPGRLRNFASHAQSLATLIDTDFWNAYSIVEDGHQFWRTYFRYDGDHKVVAVLAPIYQDAVVAGTYKRTIIDQYKQIRRWAWGVSDIPYVVRQSLANRRAPWGDKLLQLGRLFESHFSWATSSITLQAVAWLPLFLNPRFSYQTLAHELPVITSTILELASVGVIVTILISLLSLPPRPARYRRFKSIFMVAQWALLPITAIAFGSVAALQAQTRLMFGRYFVEFNVTEKARKD
jgi:hypothetical protein